MENKIVAGRWSLVAGKKICCCIISAGLLVLSYPVFNIELFAWFGFVPLFFVIQNGTKRKAFLFSYLAGLIFWGGTIYWLIHVTLLGLILVVLYLSLYFGVFGFLFKLATGNQRLATIIVPATWVFLEYLRSHLLTGFPWALLGYSQYLNLPVIQIADITGAWGVSFFVMAMNVAIWHTISEAVKHKPELKRISLCLILPVFLAALVLGYGFFRLNQKTEGDKLRISVIQGDIPQYQKWNENFKESILERYETLTKEAAKDKPDLIIWPETSVPGFIDEEKDLLERVLGLAKSVRTPILAGAITSDPGGYYNSAVLISPDGGILKRYNKIHLVPFGEYIPFEKHFPFLREGICSPVGNIKAGNEYTLFAAKKNNFAVLICFEDIFPELSKRFVKERARFLVNITNDAWYLYSSAPYQHAQASVFRAVENRVPVMRATNTGFSCFIDKYGRIYDKVSDGKKDIFVIGYKTSEVTIK